jgi:hypothetical protein
MQKSKNMISCDGNMQLEKKRASSFLRRPVESHFGSNSKTTKGLCKSTKKAGEYSMNKLDLSCLPTLGRDSGHVRSQLMSERGSRPENLGTINATGVS